MKTQKGSCHCGKVQFEIRADIHQVFECNCSMCRRKGTLLVFIPEADFKLISGGDDLSNYQFHKKVIHHTFCNNCGVTSFLSGTDRNGRAVKIVNARCLDDFDSKSVDIKQVDGKSF